MYRLRIETMFRLEKVQRKVFCIGFNKTGTSSLHQMFLHFGLRSTHSVSWTYLSHVKGAKHRFRKFDCFSDGEQANFFNLSDWYPAAVFVLNTRSDKAWLRSRVKHVCRRGHNSKQLAKTLRAKKIGLMAKGFFSDPELSLQKWLVEKRHYEAMARTFFEGSDRFVEVNVAESDNWAKQIGAHLEKNEFPLSNQFDSFQGSEKNARPLESMDDAEAIERYFLLIDKICD